VTKLSISPKGAPDDVVVDEDHAEAQETAAVVVVEDDEKAEKPKAKLPKRAVLNEDGTVTLTLIKQVSITIRKDGKDRQEAYTALTFHRLKGIDLRLIAEEPTEMKRSIMALARSTRTSSARMAALFDNLDQSDVEGATEVIAYFRS
jgi:hypothetical protein